MLRQTIKFCWPKVNSVSNSLNIQGYRNDFKDAMDKVDQAYLDEMVRTQGEDVPSSAYDIKCSDEGLTEQALIEMSLGLRKGDDELDFRVTLSFIKVS